LQVTATRDAAPGLRRVLVVEDDADHRRALVLTLRLGGYAPQECASGEEALAELGQRAAVPDDLCAVVLDVRLPGIDGIEVLTKLRHQVTTSELPVVLISAHATIPNSVQSDEHARFVPKPFHPDQLLGRLTQLLAGTSEVPR
jgi:two-component system response regulator DctR